MSGAQQQAIRASFLRQAEACDRLGSPFTATLCRLFAERLEKGHPVDDVLLAWEGPPGGTGDAVALRLTGGLHALVLDGLAPDLAATYPPAAADAELLWHEVRRALDANTDFMIERLKSAPQTNEVRRSAALLPGFLTIAAYFGKPLVLSEIGASAGLNLIWDAYRYRLGSTCWGDPGSPVLLSPK
jgi:hypothetical protein